MACFHYILLSSAVFFYFGAVFGNAKDRHRNPRQSATDLNSPWGQPIAVAPVHGWPPDQHAAPATTTTSPTPEPYVAKRGDFLTLGEASFIAGIKNNEYAQPPTAPPKKGPIQLTPKAVAALQRLPDDKLAKLISSHTNGKVILTPEKAKLFKELEPEVLADLINSGDDIDSLLADEEETQQPFPDQAPQPLSTGVPFEWYNQRLVYPAYPVYPNQQTFGQSGLGQQSFVPSPQYPQQGASGGPVQVSDAKLLLLQKLSPQSIVNIIKRQSGVDITLEEAEVVKTSSLEDLREMINSHRSEDSGNQPTGPYVQPGAGQNAQTDQSFAYVPAQPPIQPQSRAPVQVSDAKLRLLQKLKPATIVNTVRNQAGVQISLEEAEWIKTATLEELRAAMQDGTMGTPITPASSGVSSPLSGFSSSGFPSNGFQPQPGFANSGMFGPKFGKRRRRKRAAKTKAERQQDFARFYSRLPGPSVGSTGTQRGCTAYPGLGRIFFEPGRKDAAARKSIKDRQIIHRFREGTLRGNYGDVFPTAALAPYRVIPDCASNPNAGCPDDLVNTAQIKKMFKGKALLLMNCEQQELAQRLIQNGYVFNSNRPFFANGHSGR